MIKINLIPPEIHVAEVRKQMTVIGGILGGLIVVALLSFWGTRAVKAHNLEGELVQSKEELRKYQAIVDKVNQLEQTRNQLQARRDVIRQLLKGRLIYPKFFEDFMALLPPEVWITSLGTSLGQDGSLNVTVNAQSLSNFAIADWMTNLQSSRLCGNVGLGTITTQESGEGAPILVFTMTFHYLRTET